jgi:hypothetical protein
MIVRPVLASLAVLMIAASVGCGVGAGSERIDLPAFRASVAKSTGLDLVREPLGPEKREIPGLVARYTGIAPSERLVVLEFFSAALTRDVLGSRPEMRGLRIFRRENVVAFYARRRGSRQHANAIQHALQATPMQG